MAAVAEQDLTTLSLEQLPTDPLLLILSFLDYKDLMRWGTCRERGAKAKPVA